VRPYEIMVILDAGLDEDVIRATIDRASQAVTANGGSVGRVDRWGRRRFAYEVHHRAEGYYVLLEVSAEPAAIAEADRVLGLADQVVRHKVIRLPDGVAGRKPRTVSSADVPAESNANGA
jgi:small subunit ribosomal protein S6